MGGAIFPLPQYAFMAWCSVKKAQGQLEGKIIPGCLQCYAYIITFAVANLYLHYINIKSKDVSKTERDAFAKYMHSYF
jgi:hypothetical protein